jgi:hypothetical protein
MWTNKQIIIAVVIVLLIVVITNNMRLYKIYSNQMEGMWTAPESFCKQSDIDGMLVYVGPILSGTTIVGSEIRKACLIIHGNNTTIAYKKLELKIGSPFMDIILPMSGMGTSWTRYAKVSDDSGEVADPEVNIMDEADDVSTIPLSKILPNKIKITVNLNEGKMTWIGGPLSGDSTDDERAYAELYKDNASSAIGKNLVSESTDISSMDIPNV